jgi:BirA family biotin operon repressor/biotin-[acetyl-CoA-carboxylase] ligase
MNVTILRFTQLDSTNDEAIKQAKYGAEEGLCIVARQQISGRGRYGRKWFSPMDAGLYFSLLLRPKIDMESLPLITLMAAVAVHDTLEKLYKVECDIKWVNDIHINGKKVCGILTETTETEKGLAVIVGIGINLRATSLPREVANIATSIESEANIIPDSDILLENLTKELTKFYEILSHDENGKRTICEEWKKRSSYAYNKRVRVKTTDLCFEGITEGIKENGSLILKLDSGEEKIIYSGEVEELRASS